MFKEIRDTVDLMEGISKYTGLEWTPVGSVNFELEDKSCPLCEHKDCFRVKKDDEEYFFKCFSCDEHGRDIISFYSKYKQVDPFSAARTIAKDYGIETKRSLSPTQKIFELAAEFYHNALLESDDKITVGEVEYTPLQYQTEVRKHSLEVLRHEMVGYVVDGLYSYLALFDFSDEELLASGLFFIPKKGKNPRITPLFFNKGVFVYPHFCKGLTSHFTSKDPNKVLPPFQVKNEHRLNDVLFYGQDGVARSDEIVLVEGENDRLSVLALLGERQCVIATGGQVSRDQVQWLNAAISSDKKLITIFDNDDAGDKYREKFWKTGIVNLTQFKAPEGFNDVDEILKKGMKLDDLVPVPNPSAAQLEEADVIDECEVFVMKGCYYKLRKTQEGGEMPVRLSNFTMQLKNIFVKDNTRSREVVLIRNDGHKSTCPYITSAIKVSLKAFREFAADAIDGSFYGSEADLTAMWDFVYKKGGDRVVHMPKEIGALDNGRGWLFNDAFINPNGMCTLPDDENIMWVNGNTIGYKPMSNQDGADDGEGNPWHALRIRGPRQLSPDERDLLLKGFVENLAKNLGSLPAALTMVSWAKANAFSNKFFDVYGFFPFLFMWGRHAKGKTTLIKWVMSLYGMQDIGYASLPNLGTGVGFSRNMSVYSSVPMCLDEVRADQQTKNFYGHFRAWYNRQGRTLGVKGNHTKVHTQEVRSTLILGGQDVLTDAATRSRCIEVQIPTNGREMQESYIWMEQNVDNFRWIGLEWILESCTANFDDILDGMREDEKSIVEDIHCDSRIAKHWAMVSYFGNTLVKQCGLEIDFLSEVKKYCSQSVVDQEEEDVLMRFFSTVEGMQVEERSPLTSEHISLEGDDVILWMTEIIRLVKQKGGALMNEGERFSKNAILKMLQDEPYYVECTRKYMGPQKTQRRAYVLRGEELPPPLQHIRDVAKKWS